MPGSNHQLSKFVPFLSLWLFYGPVFQVSTYLGHSQSYQGKQMLCFICNLDTHFLVATYVATPGLQQSYFCIYYVACFLQTKEQVTQYKCLILSVQVFVI